jgi:thiamine biosynthesis lipoprotein
MTTKTGYLLYPGLILFVASCGSITLPEIRQTRLQLGTTVSITVIENNSELAEHAVNDAFAEIDRIELLMSSYDERSEISILNSEGSIEPDAEIVHLLERAAYFHQISAGAFDITVEPLLRLFNMSFGEGSAPPSDGEIQAALQMVGFDRIEVTSDRISLPDGMKITLGGIAKGYAIDRAVTVLQEHGIQQGLINAGGDMRSIGTNGEDPWKIALQNPRNSNDLIAILPLIDSAMATSGDYERYFDPDKRFHHIIDPRTGHSATELISVTIVAESALDADALATAVFVSGAQKGMALVNSMKNVETLIITSEGNIITSDGLKYSMIRSDRP